MTLFADLPFQFLGLALVLCLAISALGFLRVDYFVSIGYAFSIAAQAIVFGLLFRETIGGWVIAQTVLLLAYGVRLGWHLVSRESSPSFARELAASKERGAHVKGALAAVIWVSVAALYVVMFFPALQSMSLQANGADLPTVPVGVAIMIIGLALEAIADWQKTRLKAKKPSDFVHTGLYGVVRYPNYFGEMVFWLGVWISGISAYTSIGAWVLSLAGFLSIQLVMLGSTRRLEFKQAERYGGDAAYQEYIQRVPVLFPLLPVYSVKNNRLYLG